MEDLGDDAYIRITAGDLPAGVRETFPELVQPDSGEMSVIAKQLGRAARGRVLVASRCTRGRPAVILTVPVDPTGRSMPPLLWLSCPSAAGAMGLLESEGLAKEYARRLKTEPEAYALFMAQEDDFARLYLELVRRACGDGVADRIGEKGVAGGRKGSVKCLHAHLAYRLASGSGRVGGWCIEVFEGKAGLWCERVPEACLY